jgi:hypothetical protein
MGPGLNDMLRFPCGTRLRVTLVLTAAAREALQRASRHASWWLATLEGATLCLEQPAPGQCALRLEPIAAELNLIPRSGGGYLVQARLHGAPQQVPEQARAVWLQLGGAHDAYLVHHSEGATMPLLRLRYAGDGRSFGVALLTAALGARVPAALHAWLPAVVEVAQLQVLEAAAQP